MKTNKFILALMLLISFSFYAQGPKKEKVKALKVAYLTNNLSLTATEAEKFWPIYNAYDAKQFELRHEKMKMIKDKLDSESVDNLTDKQASAMIVQIESVEDDLYQNRKKFMASLKTVLSPVKILKLKKAEDDFNKTLLRQYKNKGKRD
ncbi:Spy/CpxP family protein refolding chaperone [Flavobacterium arsenatis]|uniref:Spy/CpxP family protein refolding chaperone n=1 Tax=Flavobacterium arsenatis TaxID=1484332 RepID=A0ABU1TMF1_9FLAO|nr:sensor of ECF-type sigma factor [Flavobacterium arsenatis]MDR6967115.1 Spy/CpxP family protein refolding chaperone [Flavobacterium arsenatis]